MSSIRRPTGGFRSGHPISREEWEEELARWEAARGVRWNREYIEYIERLAARRSVPQMSRDPNNPGYVPEWATKEENSWQERSD